MACYIVSNSFNKKNSFFMLPYNSTHFILYNDINCICSNQNEKYNLEWHSDMIPSKFNNIENFDGISDDLSQINFSKSEYRAFIRGHGIYSTNNYIYSFSIPLRKNYVYYLVNNEKDGSKNTIAIIISYYHLDLIRYAFDIDFDSCIEKNKKIYRKIKKSGKKYVKLPFTMLISLLVNRRKILNNISLINNILTGRYDIFYHGTDNKSMKEIVSKGIKYNVFTNHGKRKGKGFYTTQNIFVAREYSISAAKKGKKRKKNKKTTYPTIIAFIVDTVEVNYDTYNHPPIRGIKSFDEHVFRITSIIDKKIKQLYIIVNSHVRVNS